MRFKVLTTLFFLFSTAAFAIPPFDDGGGCKTVQYKWAHAPTVEIDLSQFSGKSSYTAEIPEMAYSIENGGNYNIGVGGIKIDLSQVGDMIEYRVHGGNTWNENDHSAWFGKSVIQVYPKGIDPSKSIAFKVDFLGKNGNGHPAPSLPISGRVEGHLADIKGLVAAPGSSHDTLALDDDSLKTCLATIAIDGGWTCDGYGCRGPGQTSGSIPVWTFP